jgi:2-keto-4-pentenoate hydratase
MDAQTIQDAALALIGARRTGAWLAALPASCQPASVDDAHAIQDATVAALGDAVAGWKIAVAADGALMRGVLLRSRVVASPARLPAAQIPLLGVEAEIAFRFDRALPPRDHDYDYAEVAAAVTALPAIEVVATRFTSYKDTPLLHRLADCMSNGAFVQGAPQAQWRAFNLAELHVTLTIDGTVIADRIGGHPTRDPLLPAVAMVNHQRTRGGVAAGRVMTTGTYTGLNYAKPGQTVVASFEGFGSAQVSFDA